MRADIYLFTVGKAKSRQNAKILIDSGNVKIDNKVVTNPSLDINEAVEHSIEIINKPKFVSRGGEKLEYALNNFNINVENAVCIDIGASTGGFTDCLLQRNAALVYAVDSGHNQLDPEIYENDKVISIEKYNARFIDPEDFSKRFDIAVMDVSFISQTLIHQGINSVLNENGILISLIKPQFECGKNALNSHGIVKSKSEHIKAICKIIDSAIISGFSCIDLIKSPIEGGSGNVEFLIHLQKSSSPKCLITEEKIKRITQSK